jgi:hypothetical protein
LSHREKKDKEKRKKGGGGMSNSKVRHSFTTLHYKVSIKIKYSLSFKMNSKINRINRINK